MTNVWYKATFELGYNSNPEGIDQMLYDLYITFEFSISDIVDFTCMSETGIRKHLRILGIVCRTCDKANFGKDIREYLTQKSHGYNSVTDYIKSVYQSYIKHSRYCRDARMQTALHLNISEATVRRAIYNNLNY